MKSSDTPQNKSTNDKLTIGKLLFGSICAVIITTLLLVLSEQKLLPEPPDEWFIDWRTSFFSKRADEQHKEISVVLIDENSIAEYPYRSPVDRRLISDLIKEIDSAKPAVIGVDFIFDWKTETDKDEELIKTIRNVKSPIVLGGLDSRSNISKTASTFQKNFFENSQRPVGHIYLSQHIDKIRLDDLAIRKIAEDKDGPGSWRSFGRLIAEHDGKKPELKSKYISWLLPPADGRQGTFPTFSVAKHKPRTSDTQSSLLPAAVKEALTGKIVLLGGAFSDRDRHQTPLSILDRSKMHGVMIHAHIIAQIRDGRSYSTLMSYSEMWVVALGSFVVALIGFYFSKRWKLIGKSIMSGAFLLLMILMGIIFFTYFQIILPTIILFYAWGLGVAAGSDWFLKRLHIK